MRHFYLIILYQSHKLNHADHFTRETIILLLKCANYCQTRWDEYHFGGNIQRNASGEIWGLEIAPIHSFLSKCLFLYLWCWNVLKFIQACLVSYTTNTCPQRESGNFFTPRTGGISKLRENLHLTCLVKS